MSTGDDQAMAAGEGVLTSERVKKIWMGMGQ